MSEGRYIIVSGGSSGIGAEIVRSLCAKGDSIFVCARRLDKLNELTQDGSLAFGHACDVSKEDQVKAFLQLVKEKVPRIDALINCAAIIGSIGPTVETDSREWFNTVETILFGTYLMVKHVVPLMEGAKNPRIINFAGGGAFSPFPNYSAYAVSKAGVVRLTENLAVELGPFGISVNAIAPGFVATDIHKETIESGPDLAGEAYFDYTINHMNEGSIPISVPVHCVEYLLSEAAGELTGKTISASFDPWGQPEFNNNITDINDSDIYTQRRINMVNLPDTDLRTQLTTAFNRARTI